MHFGNEAGVAIQGVAKLAFEGNSFPSTLNTTTALGRPWGRGGSYRYQFPWLGTYILV
jgi:hypothetical protein